MKQFLIKLFGLDKDLKNLQSLIDSQIGEMNTLKEWLGEVKTERDNYKILLLRHIGVIKPNPASQIVQNPQAIGRKISSWPRVRTSLENQQSNVVKQVDVEETAKEIDNMVKEKEDIENASKIG